MTAYASGTGATFPNVILPDWGSIAAKAVVQTGARFISWNPLVTHSQRTSYEQYALENQEWIQNSPNYTKALSYLNISTPSSISVHNEETGERIPEGVHDLYCPVAQIGT